RPSRRADRRRRGSHRRRVARHSDQPRGDARRGGGPGLRNRARRAGRPARRGAALAGLRIVRHVPRLRRPWRAVQERSRTAAAQGGARVNRGDRWLIVLPLVLTAVGVIMVYSSSAILGLTRYQDPNYFLSRQLFRAALGISVMLLCARLDLKNLEAWAPSILGLTAQLLVVVIGVGHVSK